MKKLTHNQLQLFKQIFRARQSDLLVVLERYLKQIYNDDRVINEKNHYVYAVGDIPIMLVAHLDTVHASPPNDIFYDKEQNVIWSPQGIGADDRAGVYGILRILGDGYRPHVLFTTDEEKGGIGATVASQILKPEVNFIIELDRQGEDDSVYYSCDNPDFEEYINRVGFVTTFGSFSDISVLCPEWEIAGVNLSIGYVDEHTKAERLYVTHMNNTIGKVEVLLSQVNVEKDKFKYIPAVQTYNRYYDYLDRMDFEIDKKIDKANLGEICYECFEIFHPDFIIPASDGGKYCGNCYPKIYTTCLKCEESFRDRTKTHLLCETCRKEGI